MGEVERGVKELEMLEDDLAQNIRVSHSRKPIYEEVDDEKVTVQKLLLKSLQSWYEQKERKESESLKGSLASQYEHKFNDLRKTYGINSQSK